MTKHMIQAEFADTDVFDWAEEWAKKYFKDMTIMYPPLSCIDGVYTFSFFSGESILNGKKGQIAFGVHANSYSTGKIGVHLVGSPTWVVLEPNGMQTERDSGGIDA